MTTTREKFRARRVLNRKKWLWGGRKWSEAQMRRLGMVRCEPLVINMIKKADFKKMWLGDPPLGGFERYFAINGQPLTITEDAGGPPKIDPKPAPLR